MKKVDKFVGSLKSTTFDPPIDDSGYYGVVLKPKWLPTPIAYMVRGLLPVRIGFLNRRSYGDCWYVYDGPNGESFHKDGKKARAMEVKPFLWCSRKTYYNVRVTFNGGNPFYTSTVEPTNEYRISK